MNYIISPQNFLALDLELNTDQDGNTTKIIQVGIAVGNINNINDIKTFKWYVDPKEPISPYITQLTGISQDDINSKAVPLQQVALDLQSIIQEYQPFVNPIQWGHDDNAELLQEFKQNNVSFPFFGHRAIDVKTIYIFLQATKNNSLKGGLRSSMNRYKLHFQGEPHRADVDAYNTLIFFFHLLKRQHLLDSLVHNAKSIT
jgi:inhibitor of KinA sporulation pathway (predicted exonuclease)